MSIENAKIECLAKPITHAFIYFKNDDERNKFVRSANMLSKEWRGRKLKITRPMDAEERFHQKRMGYVTYCIHMRHSIPLNPISLNWTSKHVSVKGQIVVKTHQSGSLKKIKYQDIESEVEDQMEKMAVKKLITASVCAVERRDKDAEMKERLRAVKCTQQHRKIKEATKAQLEAAGKSSKKLTVTFQHA